MGLRKDVIIKDAPASKPVLMDVDELIVRTCPALDINLMTKMKMKWTKSSYRVTVVFDRHTILN